jgi:hypothetical protein
MVREGNRFCAALLGGWLTFGAGTELEAQLVAGAGVSEETTGVSVLSFLDSYGRVLESGVPASGELSDADVRLPAGERVQGWSFEGDEGETVRIDLASSDFDSYLYLAGPGLGSGISDDDGGEGLDSRICTRLPVSGRYLAAASALGVGSGQYTISLQRWAPTAPGAESVDECAGSPAIASEVLRIVESTPTAGELRGEVEVTGLLDPFDPRHPDRGGAMEIWEIVAEEGDRIAFDLASDDFDTYLYLVGPGLDEAHSDDDSGVGCTGSRIWITFPASGSYRAVATSFSEGAEGAYHLIATESPTDQLDCDGGGGSAPSMEELDRVEVIPERRLELSVFPSLPAVSASALWSPIAGVEIGGSLSADDHLFEDGSRAQGWSLDALPGERFRIELESDDFDPYLIVAGTAAAAPVWNDDDGEGLNSRIEVVVAEAGVLRVIVKSAGSGGAGSFILRVLRRGSGR